MTASVLTAGLLLGGCAAIDGPSWTPFAAPAPASAADVRVSQAIDDVVIARATAIRRTDRSAFAATVADSATVAARNQFDVLTHLPISHFSLLVTGKVRASAGSRPARAQAVVTETYRLPGDDTDVSRHGPATFVRNHGTWALESWRPSRPDLWDLEAVHTATDGPVVAVAGTGQMAAADLAQMAHVAAADVSALWQPAWDGHVVVELPDTQTDFAAVGVVHAGAANIAGLTTTLRTSPDQPASVVRVYLNPAAFAEGSPLTERIILTHEVTHVAQAALPDGAPLWLIEGSADFVGYSMTDLGPNVIAQDLVGETTPTAPPADQAFRFDSSSTDLARAYEQSWTLLQSVADRDGDQAVSQLYAAVVRASGSDRQRESRAMRRVLGESRAAVLAQWQTWLADHL